MYNFLFLNIVCFFIQFQFGFCKFIAPLYFDKIVNT